MIDAHQRANTNSTTSIHRTFSHESEEPIKLKKHKVIAQAFAKRKMFNNAGRLSISFHNTHEDPVGLNFDLNSVASQDFSSTWAAALPKLVTRRGALVGGSISSTRRNSTDSQYSFSLRRVSIESRRNSCDSQFAYSFSEMKADFKTSRVVNKSSSKRRKKPPERARKRSESYKQRGRRDFEKSRSAGGGGGGGKIMPAFRRGSTTSQESQLGVQILSALSIGAAANTVVPALQVPNMKRRAGLDEGTLALKDAERLLPFLFPRPSDSDESPSSEPDNKPNDKDVEAASKVNNGKQRQRDSDNEDSQPEESTRMLDAERSRSKISNKSGKAGRPNGDRRTSAECQTKYHNRGEDETVLQHLLQDSNNEVKGKVERKSGTADLESGANGLESNRVMQQQQLEGQSHAREIATQTLPIEMLEMEALKESITEIINNRNFSSKATQISPQMMKSKKQPK